MDRLQVDWSPDLKIPRSLNAKRLYASFIKGQRRVCLSGGRSKGKTSSIWPYVVDLCLKIPGFKVVIARKEYSTLVGSTMETLNKHILKHPFYDDENNPWICDGGMNRPKKIIFHNGSTITLMGLKDPEQVRGMEMDLFWLNEGSRQDTMKAWTLVSGSQAAGRGVWKRYGESFSQIITDTNPGAPTHWLYKYFHDNEDDEFSNPAERLWLDFQLTDNPAYTDDGVNLNRLGKQAEYNLLADHPAGIDRDRYVFGKWAQAEGAVLHNFDFRRDVIKELPEMYGDHWKHYRGIDFGDDNPFVCMWSSLNIDNGKLITHREWRSSQTGLDDHAEAMKQYSDEDEYEWTIADSAHAAERRHLKAKGIPTIASKKDIKENLRLMRRRIGKGQWKVYKHLLIKKDHRLVQKNMCLDILDEIGALVYPETKNNTPADELPDKKCERHGIDAMQYKVRKLDGPSVIPDKLFV